MQLLIPEVTLLEEIGRGPGSIVFRALHHGDACTVKVASERSAPATCRSEAFERDLLQLARLSRAGLPHVLHVGVAGDSAYAIVAEVEGEPLASLLRHAIEERDALQLALKLVTCLRRLHDAGFVHGSLTLAHVLVSSDHERVNWLDLGSVQRPVPFHARVDLQALGVLLRECGKRVEQPGAGGLHLLRLAEELALAERVELGSVMAELEACISAGRKRRTSYPSPSVDALASLPVEAFAQPSRRARRELIQLRRGWERAKAGQGGSIVGVVGAAGSGKSRLLAAFADSLGDDDVQVLSVRCRDSDWAPFSTLKRLLDGHLAGFAALEPGRRRQIESSLREAAGPLASRARLLSPRLAELFRDAPATIGEGDAQQVFLAGMADFLVKYLEGSGPSVVMIDDVHWLDASSRLVLSRVASRLSSQNHMIVCGARDDAESREPLERFRAALFPQFIETLRLGPMSQDDAGQVVAEYLGLERAPGELVTQLAQLSDGTPLCLLELLRSTLEHGLLRPTAGSWRLDSAQAQRMRLPASSRALVERRLAALDQASLEVLRAAAVMRDEIDLSLLARITNLERGRVRDLCDGAVAAGLLEWGASGRYRFIHDTIWEALLRELPAEARRELHQSVADALFDQGGEGADYEYQLARLCASGAVERAPARAFETNRRAARRAVQACDDALAMQYLKAAEHAAELAKIDPGRELYLQLAETHLRAGDTPQSLSYFEQTLMRSKPGFERAHVRGRIAWIHHYESNDQACGQALEAALAETGHGVPGNHLPGFAVAVGRWAAGALRSSWRRKRQVPPTLEHSEEDTQALCQLYAACFRVAVDEGRPLGALSSVLAMARRSQELRPCRPVVHADLLLGFVFGLAGLDQLMERRVERAEQMARALGDPIAQTLIHSMRHVIQGWRGNLDESGRHARACVDERGHWMELGELCQCCFAMYGIEILRGRPESALAWIERAIERVRRTNRAPAMFSLIEDAAVSTLIALGREREIGSWQRRLRFVERTPLQRDGYFHVLSFQSRVQRYTESGELGAEFEALVDEFEALKLDPKRVHILVAVYYQHVAHARVHQCLRAEPAARAALLPKLQRACADVEAASRVPALKAHSHALRAAERWFAGDAASAKVWVARAERVAEETGCSWASFAAARLRAHMLRAEGNELAAADQARIAALWARQYGQVSRLRFLAEEFGGKDVVLNPERSEAEPPSTRRNLDALLRISHANSRELGPEGQASVILDELLEALGAERALLFMRGEGGALVLAAGRRAGAGELESSASYDRGLIEQVYATGQTQLTEGSDDESPNADRACIAVALVLREQAVGVLYLDRAELAGSFRSEDAALLSALASQVSLALELGRSLRERERLQQNLQQAQTMEAVGRLAGGIAHDFNNILAAIQYAASSLAELATVRDYGREELDDIQTAARRGADLTRQLLGLSRGKTLPPPPKRIVVAEAVRGLLPMLRRLVRPDVRIALDLANEPLATLADLSQLERVLMNLFQNASDAMPHGGTITIRVAPLAIDELNGPNAALGTSHVLLSVTDTGTGMNDEVRTRLFEPFFTTKPQRGTGLGLANVYTIVQQCRGTIEVTSELGVGSCFQISLPRCAAAEPTASVRFLSEVRPAAAVNGCQTVLVVDDDDAVRRMVVRTLEIGGYRVLSAPDGEAALRIVDAHAGLFALVVTDMHMPGMDGSRLGKLLHERDPDVKMLFLSGDDSDDLEESGLLSRDAAFLHKPFRPDVLLSQVRDVLHASTRTPDALRELG